MLTAKTGQINYIAEYNIVSSGEVPVLNHFKEQPEQMMQWYW